MIELNVYSTQSPSGAIEPVIKLTKKLAIMLSTPPNLQAIINITTFTIRKVINLLRKDLLLT